MQLAMIACREVSEETERRYLMYLSSFGGVKVLTHGSTPSMGHKRQEEG